MQNLIHSFIGSLESKMSHANLMVGSLSISSCMFGGGWTKDQMGIWEYWLCTVFLIFNSGNDRELATVKVYKARKNVTIVNLPVKHFK